MSVLEIGSTIGLVDEGQLGRMITEAAHDYGYQTSSLGPVGKESPAGRVGSNPVIGKTSDADSIHRLANVSDVITLDSEHGANTAASGEVEDAGKLVSPSPRDLAISQDKWKQKLLMRQAGIPFAQCMLLESPDDLAQAREDFGENLIAKARKGAYDGRGNRDVVTGMEWDDIVQTFTDPNTGQRPDLYIEKKLAFVREIAIVVAKGIRPGDYKAYRVVETRQTDHICDVVIASEAIIDGPTESTAKNIGWSLMHRMRNPGIMAVEMFDMGNGDVLANEFALRVHNSGHWTDHGAVTSQFHQNVRAVTGMRLGSTEMRAPVVVMKNILGLTQHDTVPSLEGITLPPNVFARLYDKTPRPARKIGHFTILGNTVEEALHDAEEAHARIIGQI